MDKKNLIKLKEEILFQLELKKIKAKEIKIFGSSKTKDFESVGDIDVIIVSDDFNNKSIFTRSKMTRGIHLAMVKKFNKPFDLLYVSSNEWNKNRLMIEV